MIPLLVALATAQGAGPPPLPWAGGRVYTSRDVHVGVRPALVAAPRELVAGVTVQVTVRWLP